MKIAYIVRQYHKTGGISLYVAELAATIPIADEVHIFSSKIKTSGENIVKHFVQAIRFKYLEKKKKYSLYKFLEISSFMAVSKYYVDNDKYDIVHSQGDFMGKCDVYTAHSCHKAWLAVAQRNRTGWLDALKKSSFNPLHYCILKSEQYAVKRARKIIAISEVVRKELTEQYPFTADKIEVIYNGVNTDRFKPGRSEEWRKGIRDRYAIGADDTVIIFPAHEFRRKGLTQIIEALSILKRDDIYVLVVGKDDPTRYINMSKNMCLSKNVIFAGERADIEKYYAASDLMVFPTLYEPFGLVVTEAMASGVPVIVSAIAGAAELVKDGVNGVLLKDRNDSSEIADKIKQLVDDREKMAEIGKNARATVEKYSWDEISKQTYGLYERILTEKNK